jgi:hypothetical protein
LRLSIVVEWANTRLNGVFRAWTLLDILGAQWRALAARSYPATLPAGAPAFLDRLDPRAELIVVTGDGPAAAIEEETRRRLPPLFDVEVLAADGLEYYALKNRGAERARGDLLFFVDSDVALDPDCMAHLLGSFAQPGVDVVCGQTYVAPVDLFSRAFALGWTYPLPDKSANLRRAGKFYANGIAFRTEVFRQIGFPPIGPRTRGATKLLGQALARRGIPVWENPRAGVAHPPPAGFRHLAVRALAHGRDHYMDRSEERHLYGLARSVGLAAARLSRGFYRTFREGRRVGLEPWELPAVLAICSSYYAFFALGGVLTHVSPRAMGRRFRV